MLLSRLNSLAVDILAPLLAGREYALLDWPSYRNIGDHMIWIGEQILLSGWLGARRVYLASKEEADVEALASLPPGAALVFTGGGNFGDRYPDHQLFRERIVAAFPDRRIVLLPQTVHYGDLLELERTVEVYARHPDLHILCRSTSFYDVLRERLPNATVRLCSDCALFLLDVVPAVIQRQAVSPARAVLHLMRDDGESAAKGHVLPAGAMVCDWYRGMPKEVSACAVPDPKELGLHAVLTSPADLESWEHFCRGAALLSMGTRVVTDRLHGHILACLLGKEHILYDNDYGKNSSFFRTWHEYLPPFSHLVQTASSLQIDAV